MSHLGADMTCGTLDAGRFADCAATDQDDLRSRGIEVSGKFNSPFVVGRIAASEEHCCRPVEARWRGVGVEIVAGVSLGGDCREFLREKGGVERGGRMFAETDIDEPGIRVLSKTGRRLRKVAGNFGGSHHARRGHDIVIVLAKNHRRDVVMGGQNVQESSRAARGLATQQNFAVGDPGQGAGGIVSERDNRSGPSLFRQRSNQRDDVIAFTGSRCRYEL